MPATIYRAETRGHARFGWLDSHHLFSFGHYFDPERIRFGMLRVFNDDVVLGGEGFGTHPHDNMEIVSIPLEGTIAHKDSMGHTEALVPGDVQVMSAGTGITHSEYNGSPTDVLKFLQIWVIPNVRGVEPRYDQKSFDTSAPGIHTVVGPKGGTEPLWIHQDAWFSLVRLEAGSDAVYTAKRPGNGLLLFVVEGTVSVNGELLGRRDAIGVHEEDRMTMTAADATYAVLIDVPMA